MRSETSLVQTIGRAARHANGKVILYADRVTPSMERAITETDRRRKMQKEYNNKHNITPTGITKEIFEMMEISTKATVEGKTAKRMSVREREELINKLTAEMKNAAKILEFEHAAYLRDKINALKEKR